MSPPQSSNHEQQLSDMNEALLASSVCQHELTDQAQKAEAKLRESEAQFRELVKQVKDYAIFRTDLGDRAITWNEGVERVLGFAEDEFIGTDITQAIFTPEDIAAGVPQEELNIATRTGAASNDRWMRRKDGVRFFALGATTALRDGEGRVTGFSKVMRDHTRLKQAEDALRESEEQFRRAIEDAPVPVIMHAEDGEVLQLSRSWTELTGYRIEDIPTVESAYGFGADAVRDRMQELFQGTAGMIQMEFEIATRSRETRVWVFSASSPGALRDGRRFVVGMAVDISDRKQAEERQRLLLAELQHRVRNTLAVVRSIARRTAKTSETVDDYVMRFDGRLSSFARVQAALTRDPAAGMDLENLVAEELISYAAGEDNPVSIAGPPVRLRPKAAESFALALHELATNAMKHGALSEPDGRLDVRWRFADGEDGSRLIFDWSESGLELDGRGPRRSGFGTELLERIMAYDLNATTALRFEPNGLRYTADLPLTDRIALPNAPREDGRF